LVLAGLFWLIQTAARGDQPSIFVEMFGYLAWINFALAVFNLVPGFPLDGGRLFRAFWWWKTGSIVDATRVASDWGKGFAVVLMIFGGLQIFTGSLVGGLWLIFIGMFLRGIAEASYQELLLKRSLDGRRVDQVMSREIVSISPELSVKSAIADYFLRYGYRGFPVRTNGTVHGIISLPDVKDLSVNEQDSRTVGEVMSAINDAMVVAPETPVSEALQRMSEENIARLLVMDDGRMVGMFTQTGVLRYLEIHKAFAAA
jgi:CBS domain-containing protein